MVLASIMFCFGVWGLVQTFVGLVRTLCGPSARPCVDAVWTFVGLLWMRGFFAGCKERCSCGSVFQVGMYGQACMVRHVFSGFFQQACMVEHDFSCCHMEDETVSVWSLACLSRER